VLVEGPSDEHEYVLMGRHAGQAPDIDGQVYLSGGEARHGEIRRVTITQASDYDLVGELIDEGTETRQAALPRRVGLRVLQTDGR
jgi:ribosomal protein S12 methylthiotransferase